MLTFAAASWIPSHVAAQAWAEAGVLRRPPAGTRHSAMVLTLRDTSASPPDNRPTTAGSIFIGSLAWYPGAIAGLIITARGSCYGDCSGSGSHDLQIGVIGGGGLATGLVVGAIARTSPRCTRGQALRAAVLGAEIGSFGTAGATGLLGNGPIHDVPAIAALALPVVSAAAATLMTRSCQAR